MNQKYAVVEGGIVINMIVFDPEPKPNWIQSDTASIGDLWDGKVFTRPEPVVIPVSEPKPSAEEILAALIKKGVLTDDDLK